MLETVREYAAEQLELSGDTDSLHARHSGYVRDLMATRMPELDSGADDEVEPLLAAEFGNVQAAFAWLVASRGCSRCRRVHRHRVAVPQPVPVTKPRRPGDVRGSAGDACAWGRRSGDDSSSGG